MGLWDVIGELCAPCTGAEPVPGSGGGGLGAPFGSFGSPSSGGPGSGGDPGGSPGGDPGDGPPDDGRGPDAEDIATDVGTGLATDAGLDIAGEAATRAGGTGLASTMLGILATFASGSQTAAEGYVAVKSSKGRGFGGGSKAAQDAFDQIAADKANNQELARQMAEGK